MKTIPAHIEKLIKSLDKKGFIVLNFRNRREFFNSKDYLICRLRKILFIEHAFYIEAEAFEEAKEIEALVTKNVSEKKLSHEEKSNLFNNTPLGLDSLQKILDFFHFSQVKGEKNVCPCCGFVLGKDFEFCLEPTGICPECHTDILHRKCEKCGEFKPLKGKKICNSCKKS